MTTSNFYRTVFDGASNELVPVFLKHSDGDTKRTLFANVATFEAEMAEIIQSHPDYNVFFGTGLLAERPASGRGTTNDVTSVGFLYFDIDEARSEASHYASESVVSLDQLRSAFTEIGLAPTTVTSTGGGSHVGIALDKRFHIRTEQDRSRVATVFRGVSLYVKERLAERGWDTDITSDLVRMDRAPDSLNVKDPANPKLVTVDFIDAGQRYSLEQLEAFMPAAASVAPSLVLGRTTDTEAPEKLANFDAIYAGDAWVRHCVADAATLKEPEWFAFLTVLGHCENGEALAHRFSQPHAEYDEGKTAEKFRHAKGHKPTTYDYIRQIVADPVHESFGLYGTAKSPISLGYIEPALAGLLAQYAFVVAEDRYVRIGSFETRSRPAFDAENLHLAGLKSPSNDFLRSPLAIKAARRDYRPGHPRLINRSDGTISLNTYVNSGVSPVKGHWPLIELHLRTLFPIEADRSAILDRLAMSVQRPGEKIKSGVLLFGPEGGGKGALIELVKALVGSENVVVLPSSAIDDDFQDDRINKQAAIFNEVSGINKRGVNSLKELITEPEIMVQGKGIPRHKGRTPSQVWITTNDDAALQLNKTDRRWLVLRTPDTPPGSSYFNQLFAAIPKELPGFAAALRERDLSAFDPNARPPVTSAKLEMIENAMSPLEYAIKEARDAEIGVFKKDFGTAQQVINAVIANGWSGRTPHANAVGRLLNNMGIDKMERVSLLDPKPYLYAWRNPAHWLSADRDAILEHLGLRVAQLPIEGHPAVVALAEEAASASV